MADHPYLQEAGAGFKDRYLTKVSEIIKEYKKDKGQIEGAGMIGAPLSKSSISHSGACLAPQTIRNALGAFTTYAIEEDIDISQVPLYDVGDVEMHMTDIAQSQQRIFETVTSIFRANPSWLPIVLGGDNSVSFPAIKAYAENKGTVGVIQFDAHHDVRNLEDGGPTNGTPFRSLLESKVIEGKNLVQVGIRDFSNSKTYRRYVEEQGGQIYTMKDVRERKITEILSEAMADLVSRVDSVYVSLDMDVVDQSQAPGCPAIGPGGMDTRELFEGISYLGSLKLVGGLEIVEIDPTVDIRDMTSRVAAHVILHFLKAKSICKAL
ncbi:formimidoylglutamase [Salipaludibacillus keqinensis]|uniref:Formimidoylglutamase n=1 Tax=Salipaludibacillus keqinensis TaxID=2045207 RepID=A0A323T863_9BACI|nr:formimidoylglutamase [Salipaludibacillus keqinensis]PYZ91998.1 formimidoylglutamase [Salipaludibacillus keqinensis]